MFLLDKKLVAYRYTQTHIRLVINPHQNKPNKQALVRENQEKIKFLKLLPDQTLFSIKNNIFKLKAFTSLSNPLEKHLAQSPIDKAAEKTRSKLREKWKLGSCQLRLLPCPIF